MLPYVAVVDLPQLVEHLPGEWCQVGSGGVGPRLLGVARAGDHRAHAGLVDDPAQGELGGGRAGGRQGRDLAGGPDARRRTARR